MSLNFRLKADILNASRLANEMPTWELASRLTSSLSQTRTWRIQHLWDVMYHASIMSGEHNGYHFSYPTIGVSTDFSFYIIFSPFFIFSNDMMQIYFDFFF